MLMQYNAIGIVAGSAETGFCFWNFLESPPFRKHLILSSIGCICGFENCSDEGPITVIICGPDWI